MPRCLAAPIRLILCSCGLTVYSGVASAQLAERAAQAILAAPPGVNAVWPGYSIQDRSWVIVDGRGAVLVTTVAPPPLFAQMTVAGVPGLMSQRTFYRTGAVAEMAGTVNTRFAIGEVRGTAIAARENLTKTVELLSHEAFHTFQHEAFAPGAETASPATVPREYAASVEVERRTLRDALKRDGDTRRNLVRQAVAIRAMRNRSAAQSLAAAEASAERIEGMAQYVEVHVTAQALGNGNNWPRDQVVAQLGTPLRAFAGSPGERLVRFRAYATGAAIGILLDALDPRTDTVWKARVQRGAAPGDLLAGLAAVPGDSLEGLAREALDRYGYDKLVAEASPSWGTLVPFTEEEFLRLAPFRLIMDVDTAARSSFNLQSTASLRGVDRPRGIQRPEEGLLVLLDLTRLTLKDSGLVATVASRPVSLDSRRAATGRQLVTILLDSPPRVNDALLAEGTSSEVNGARITGNGVDVVITGRATVTAEAGILRVVLKR